MTPRRRYHLRRLSDGKTLAMATSTAALKVTSEAIGCEWFLFDMKTQQVCS